MTSERVGLDADRIIAAVRRHLVRPDLTIEGRRDRPTRISFRTSWYRYIAQPAEWLVSREPWVDEAVRVTAESGADSMATNYGFLFGRDGEEWFLNDVATMRDLGRRLGEDLSPIGFAELLAEFYSAGNIDGPVVQPVSVTAMAPAGVLIRDVSAFIDRYPFVDPGLVAPPTVRTSDGGVSIEFFSYHHFTSGYSGAVDVMRWTVTGGAGRPAVWSREYVAERLMRP
jgi:hypothetical protein